MRHFIFLAILIPALCLAQQRTPEEQARHDELWAVMGCSPFLAADRIPPQDTQITEQAGSSVGLATNGERLPSYVAKRYEDLQKELRDKSNRFRTICLSDDRKVGIEVRERVLGPPRIHLTVWNLNNGEQFVYPASVSFSGGRQYFAGGPVIVFPLYEHFKATDHPWMTEIDKGWVLKTGAIAGMGQSYAVMSCMSSPVATSFRRRLLNSISR